MGARIQLTLALVCALLMLSDGPAAMAGGDLLGTPGPDLLRGTRSADQLDGLGGDDELRGRSGADLLQGGRGRDTLLGGGGRDFLHGGGGPDRIRAGRGSDRLLGRGGADQLSGAGGNDALAGGPGNDVVRPGPGADRVHLGTGRDRAVLSPDGAADHVDCGGGQDRVSLVGGADPLDSLVGCEVVLGGVVAEPAPADDAFLTLHFGRTQWEQRDATCTTALPDSKTLLDVAEELRLRGLKAVGHVVVDRTSDTGTRICENRFAYPTWDDLALLRDTYGWTFVSAGQTYANMTTLTPDEQRQESCGSLDAFTAHGHLRANGMFAYPNNKFTPEIQNDVVSTCFAYGRKYGAGDNARAEMAPPHLQTTVSVNGGGCNDPADVVCSDTATHGGRRYQLPSELAAQMSPEADHWSAVQFYRFVEGSRNDPEDPNFAWDCTSPDATQHWTTKAEIYCWEDYKAALDLISPDVTVTDPLAVAYAWGRLP